MNSSEFYEVLSREEIHDVIQRGLKTSLERHKVFGCCIEFQTGFPPTKTKKLPKSTADISNIYVLETWNLLHAALNPFLLSPVSTKVGGMRKKSRIKI